MREQRQLEFPISDNSQALVLDSWRHSQFGDRQAGEEVVCLGESGNHAGNRGGQSGHGRKDGAQVSPTGASTERIDARTAVADTRGLLSGGLGRSTELAGGERWTGGENDL